MKLKRILGVSVLLITITTFVAFAQEPDVSAPAVSTMPADLAPAPMQNEDNTQWAWGEVTNLDDQDKTLTLKYLDYETDQEKELLLAVDEKTTYENIKSFDEIKVKDTLSVDYTADPGDKYTAKNISLETPDAIPPAPSQPDTNTSQPGASMEMPAPVSAQPQPGAAAESQAQ